MNTGIGPPTSDLECQLVVDQANASYVQQPLQGEAVAVGSEGAPGIRAVKRDRSVPQQRR